MDEKIKSAYAKHMNLKLAAEELLIKNKMTLSS